MIKYFVFLLHLVFFISNIVFPNLFSWKCPPTSSKKQTFDIYYPQTPFM